MTRTKRNDRRDKRPPHKLFGRLSQWNKNQFFHRSKKQNDTDNDKIFTNKNHKPYKENIQKSLDDKDLDEAKDYLKKGIIPSTLRVGRIMEKLQEDADYNERP